jgi:arylsulfatase A
MSLLVRWPAKIVAGTTSDETVCLIDLIDTVAALVNYDLPNTAAEDSYDIGPAL